MIIGQLGEVLAGPMIGVSGLLTAKIDTDELVHARYDFDVSGHYSRLDVFSLTVGERPKPGVTFYK
ncbi:hypothetical protein LU631_03245 [Erwinia tracheiphila]|nr:amidohydrolase [Erwinia tracheiphila]EOS95305.1 amidohydrolase [Erwinia tracheiphila PSU-1]UIA83364.1 hypothetical protein LU604_24190 [Erwinia tracheiphila]UIA88450.1 hypothetical protein LU631_03245 [Erwinia tracheiphila]UIA91884.1 hypothetical protein LU632_23195 [Erwinia tracheiphila]UIA96828.1 hypothetical protein LU633_01920 [Erwinia tracheiphila]